MRPRTVQIPRLILLGVLPAALIFTTAGSALAGLIGGTLPTAGFQYTSVTVNDVNMTGGGVHLKIKSATTIKTTYSTAAPSEAFLGGWHFHNGLVIVSVTTGTLTFYDAQCGTWDVSAGQSYIESTGQVLNAKALPAKNAGIATVEWFSTRLYPEGTDDPAPVAAPC